MSKGGFRDFFNKALFKSGGEEEPVEELNGFENSEISDEELTVFEENDSSDIDISGTAQGIIDNAQELFDESTNIAKVQDVLELLGEDPKKAVVQNVLLRLAGCNDLSPFIEDGLARQEAIRAAVENTSQSAMVLQNAKKDEENDLKEAAKTAESMYSNAVSAANQNCETAIQKKREECEHAIETIRQTCDENIQAAKEARDNTLKDIAEQRKANETCVRQSAALIDEIEKAGDAAIKKINIWLDLLS